MNPVMKREFASRMYSPTAYWFGRFLSNMIIQTAYPLIMIVCIFWFLDIDTDGHNFGLMLTYGLIANWIFAC